MGTSLGGMVPLSMVRCSLQGGMTDAVAILFPCSRFPIRLLLTCGQIRRHVEDEPPVPGLERLGLRALGVPHDNESLIPHMVWTGPVTIGSGSCSHRAGGRRTPQEAAARFSLGTNRITLVDSVRCADAHVQKDGDRGLLVASFAAVAIFPVRGERLPFHRVSWVPVSPGDLNTEGRAECSSFPAVWGSLLMV